MKPWYLLVCILVLALILCPPVPAAENATPKAVVLDLSLNNDVVHVIGSRVVNNYPPDNRATKKIVIRVLDDKGALLMEQGIDDPRVAYVEEGVVMRDNVNFSVIVPFRRDIATIRLLNGSTGVEMLSADVSGSVNGYCKAHGDDPDCAAAGMNLVLIGAGVVLLLVLAIAGWFVLKKKKAPEQEPPSP